MAVWKFLSRQKLEDTVTCEMREPESKIAREIYNNIATSFELNPEAWEYFNNKSLYGYKKNGVCIFRSFYSVNHWYIDNVKEVSDSFTHRINQVLTQREKIRKDNALKELLNKTRCL